MRKRQQGMKIAITRLEGKENDDKERCSRRGHDCFSISPMKGEKNQEQIDLFIQGVRNKEFDCIFFTSALPASYISPLLQNLPLPRVVAIGPQTGKTLRECGVPCEVLPEFYSRAFVPYLGEWISGKKIGIPRSDAPNEKLLSDILEAGGEPREFQIYALIPTYEELEVSGAEAILFTSALSFKTAIWKRRDEHLIMAIGDVTAEVMNEAGLPPDVTGDGSLEGTLDELNIYLLMNP